jgi:hypothetical protein
MPKYRLDTGFVGSISAEDEKFSRAVKVHSMTSFRGEVKLLAPYCKNLQHVKKACGV